MHVFRIDDSERHWFVADDEKEAVELFKKFCIEVWEITEEDIEIDKVTQMGDDEELTIVTEDYVDRKSVKKCKEWAAESPKGFLCSTCY